MTDTLTAEEARMGLDLPDSTEYRVRIITERTGLLGGARSVTTKIVYYPSTEEERARATFDWYMRDPHPERAER
jgi:hypothetical protein